MVSYFSLGGCGGGGGSVAGPSLVTTTATLTPNETDYLYANFTDFEGAQNHAMAVDTTTGAITIFETSAQLERFLNKQPDPLVAPNFASNDPDGPNYLALSHLSHQLGRAANANLGFNAINQQDPGNYLLFGKTGPIANQMPSEGASYQMATQYFCSHCETLFGQASASLITNPDANSALFEMTNDEIALTLPFSVTSGSVQLDITHEAFSFTKQGEAQSVQQSQSATAFYGPNGEQAGLIFSLIQQEGLLTGAAIGTKQSQ